MFGKEKSKNRRKKPTVEYNLRAKKKRYEKYNVEAEKIFTSSRGMWGAKFMDPEKFHSGGNNLILKDKQERLA